MAHIMRFTVFAFCDSLYQIIRMAHMMQFTRSLLFVTVYIRSSEWPTWCDSHGLCFLWQFILDHQNGPHYEIHSLCFLWQFISDHQNAPRGLCFCFFDQSIHIGSSECPTWSLGFFYRSLHIRLSECSRWWDSHSLCFCFDSLYQIIRTAHMMRLVWSLFLTDHIRSSEQPTRWDSHGLCFWQFTSDHQNSPYDETHMVFAFDSSHQIIRTAHMRLTWSLLFASCPPRRTPRASALAQHSYQGSPPWLWPLLPAHKPNNTSSC